MEMALKPKAPFMFTRIFLVEFLSCLFFTFCATLNNTAFTNGTVLACWVYFSSHVSSAHLNPAVTLAFVLLGHHHFRELPVYWMAQIGGALVGATFVRFLIPWSITSKLGCFQHLPELNAWQVCGIEFLLTMSFIISIFVVVYYTRDKLGFGNMGPLLIGIALTANILAGGAYTGAALNPARVIASPIIIGCDDNVVAMLHAYVLGHFAGALGAVLVIVIFFGINADTWYGHLLTNKHMDVLPAFDYTTEHEEAPKPMIAVMQSSTSSRSRRLARPRASADVSERGYGGGGGTHHTVSSAPATPELFPLTNFNKRGVSDGTGSSAADDPPVMFQSYQQYRAQRPGASTTSTIAMAPIASSVAQQAQDEKEEDNV